MDSFESKFRNLRNFLENNQTWSRNTPQLKALKRMPDLRPLCGTGTERPENHKPNATHSVEPLSVGWLLLSIGFKQGV